MKFRKPLLSTVTRRLLEALCLTSFGLGLLFVMTGGVDVSNGWFTLSIHSPWRAFLLALIFLAARFAIDPRHRRNEPGRAENDEPGDPRFVTVGFLLLAALIFFIFQARFSTDDYFYYDYLRSLFFDADLSFLNERAIHHPSWVWIRESNLVQPTPTGYVRNVFAAGVSLLWLPFFLIGHGCALISRLAGGRELLTGYSTPYLSVLCTGSITYTFIGLVLAYRMCRRLVGGKWSFASVLLVFSGSPLLYYTFKAPGFSHGMSFFTTALFIHLWLRQRARPDRRDAVVFGLVGGLMTIVRWQNLLFFCLPAFDWLMAVADRVKGRSKTGVVGEVSLQALISSLFALMVCVPQMVIFKVLNGGFLKTGSWVALQQEYPKILEVLFAPRNGLFSWSPILLPALAGLLILLYRKPRLGVPLLAAVVLQVMINSTAYDWWGGGGFGMRRMCATLPIFILGLGYLMERIATGKWRRVLLGGSLAAVGWSWFLLVFHLSLRHAKEKVIRPDIFAFEHWPSYWQTFIEVFRTATVSVPWGWAFLPLFIGFLYLPIRMALRGRGSCGEALGRWLVPAVVLGCLLLAGHLWATGQQARTIEVLELGDSQEFGRPIPFRVGNRAEYQGGYKEWRITTEQPLRVDVKTPPRRSVLTIVTYADTDRALEQGTVIGEIIIQGRGDTSVRLPLRWGIETGEGCTDRLGFASAAPTAALPVVCTVDRRSRRRATRFSTSWNLPPGLKITRIVVRGRSVRTGADLVVTGICFEEADPGRPHML